MLQDFFEGKATERSLLKEGALKPATPIDCGYCGTCHAQYIQSPKLSLITVHLRRVIPVT